MKSKNLRAWLAVPAILLFFAACGRQEEKPAAVKAEKKLNVVTTVAPITSIVENVAGDKIQLKGIIPEGINSHTFEPVPSDVKILAAADLLIVNGLDLEIPTLKLARANMKQGARGCCCSATRPSPSRNTSTTSAFPKIMDIRIPTSG